MATKTSHSKTIILDKGKRRSRRFASLRPDVISSSSRISASLKHAATDSLWISYEEELTKALVRSLAAVRHSKPLGCVLLLYRPHQGTVPTLTACFKKFAYSIDGGFLPPEQLAEVLSADDKSDLFLGGTVDYENEMITLWRGDLRSFAVPFSAFTPSGDGIKPDFKAFRVSDYGHTVSLGKYEAAADALLYELDPDYRKKLSRQRAESDRSFGSALRRLRKQRGLAQGDFSPLSPKTIARIERGMVKRLRPKTLSLIAERLRVEPEAIETF